MNALYLDRWSNVTEVRTELNKDRMEHIWTYNFARYLEKVSPGPKYTEFEFVIIGKGAGLPKNQQQFNDVNNCGPIAVAQMFQMMSKGVLSVMYEKDFPALRKQLGTFFFSFIEDSELTKWDPIVI